MDVGVKRNALHTAREITRIIYVSRVWEEPTLILRSHPWLCWEKAPPCHRQHSYNS